MWEGVLSGCRWSNVFLLLYICVFILLCMGPHTTVCVLILLYMLGMQVIQRIPATVYMCLHTTMYVSSYYCICVLIRLCMCPHTTLCVLILLYMSSAYIVVWGGILHSHNTFKLLVDMRPHTTRYVLRILLSMPSYYYMCPHTSVYVCSY